MFSRCVPADLRRRYCFDGNLNNLFKRVTDHIAPTHKDRDLFLSQMCSKRFIPAGATLIDGAQTLTPNCSVIGTVSDSNKEEKIDLYRRLLELGTGVGIDLSGSSDPVDTLKEFSKVALDVKLKWGRPLRGNMAVLSSDHPKIEEFITCKVDNEDVSIFNISVSVTDGFMSEDNRILQLIVEASHKSADPGLVFIDRVQCTDSGMGRIVTCSPCGELFMHDGETCNLGSINLDEFVVNGSFMFKEYIESITIGTRFLDLVVDKQNIVDSHMREITRTLRRLGLGVQGFATMLDKIGVRYESDSALQMADELGMLLTKHSRLESIRLADQYGTLLHNGRRNITTTAIPPTGGIRRLVADDGFSIEPKFSEVLSIDPYWSIMMHSTWQASIENAVSKTVNIPQEASYTDVMGLYITAYNLGCKGVTIYRDGSRNTQPIKCGDGGCIV